MFVKFETHKRATGDLLACYLAESVRTPAGPRHNIIGYIGSITIKGQESPDKLRRFWLLVRDRLAHIDGLSREDRQMCIAKIAERVPTR